MLERGNSRNSERISICVKWVKALGESTCHDAENSWKNEEFMKKCSETHYEKLISVKSPMVPVSLYLCWNLAGVYNLGLFVDL